MSRKTTPSPSAMWPVLVTVLEDELFAAGLTRGTLVEPGAQGQTAAALSRIATGATVAPRQGVDAVVDVYAKALKREPAELWRKALDRWHTIGPNAEAWVAEWRDQHQKEMVARTGVIARSARKRKESSRRTVSKSNR